MPEAVREEARVIVAGAGPAGLIAAKLLAQAGIDVLVIDKGPPEALGRGLRVSIDERAFADAGLDFPEPPVRLASPQYRELTSPDNQSKIRIADLKVVRVDLGGLLTGVAADAQQAGARLLFETPVTGPIQDRGRVTGVVGTTADGRLFEAFAPLVIEATGAAASIRQGLDPATGVDTRLDPSAAIDAWQASREIDREMVRDLMAKNRLRPQTNVCRLGFASAFSIFSVFLDLDDDRVDITAGAPPGGTSAREIVEGYIETHHWIREAITEGGGPIPLGRPMDNMAADGLLVLGDAARQALPLHGAGVASALLAGRIAAEVALAALEKDDLSQDALWPYNVRYMAARGAVQANHELFRRLVAAIAPEQLSALMRRRLVTAEGARGALEGLPLEPPRGSVLALLGRPRLALSMFQLNRAVHRALDHYLLYPNQFDPDGFARWRRGLARFFPSR